MRSLNIETRVGLFAIITLLLLAFGTFWLNGGRLMERGNHVEILFNRVDGLRPGAPVKLSGVDVGRVKKIYFSDKQQVMVVVLLKPEFKLLEGSKASITTAGVIGEKHLEIQPGNSQRLLKGNKIRGMDPVTTEDFYKNASKIMSDLKSVTSSLKSLTEDKEVMSSIKNSLEQIDSFTANMENFSQRMEGIPLESMVGKIDRTLGHIETMASTTGPGLDRILKQVSTASDQLTLVLVKANRFMDDVNGDGKAAKDIRNILDLASRTMKDIEAFAATLASEKDHLGPILGDAEKAAHSIALAADSLQNTLGEINSDGTSQSSLGSTIKKASDMVTKAHQIVSTLSNTEHRLGLSVVDEKWQLNYHLDIPYKNKSSVIFDWQDIGNNNSLSLQAGYSLDTVRLRGGYIHENFGIGMDWTPTTKWEFSFDIWDPDDPKGDFYARYAINSHWYTGFSAYDLANDPIFGWQVGYWF